MRVADGPVAGPVFDHLHRLSDGRGLFEHARHGDPRREHGYCLDDVARALVVVCREPYPSPQLQALGRRFLDFTVSALQADGSFHNRMNDVGDWTDRPAVGDWWGRALWGLGVAAVHAPTAAMRGRALLAFRTAARCRSPHLRAMAYAALGAGELLLARPDELAARQLLLDTVALLGGSATDPAWPWPEPRLTYGNGTIVEALLVAGEALPDRVAQARGLYLLQFLLGQETRNGHLSVTPVGGRGRSDPRPGFDQQPIEAAAIGAACARAYGSTDDLRWLDGLQLSWAWFLGDNDAETPMFDPSTGAGFDGLQRQGCNLNQGAESTLAALATAQLAQHFVPIDCP
ncbi:MAG TPA: hypothetical protein VGL21_11805 [Jatrophihabitantaceae bacterium]